MTERPNGDTTDGEFEYDPIRHLLDQSNDALHAQLGALRVALRTMLPEDEYRESIAGVLRDALFFGVMDIVQAHAGDAYAEKEQYVDVQPAIDWLKLVLSGLCERLADHEGIAEHIHGAEVPPITLGIQIIQRD